MKATLHKVIYDEETKILMTEEVEIDLPTKDRLEFMQKIVGGLIEIYNYHGRDWAFNEEGLLLRLPLNPWAAFKGLKIVGNIIEIHGELE